jgi:hypothetical protein
LGALKFREELFRIHITTPPLARHCLWSCCLSRCRIEHLQFTEKHERIEQQRQKNGTRYYKAVTAFSFSEGRLLV